MLAVPLRALPAPDLERVPWTGQNRVRPRPLVGADNELTGSRYPTNRPVGLHRPTRPDPLSGEISLSIEWGGAGRAVAWTGFSPRAVPAVPHRTVGPLPGFPLGLSRQVGSLIRPGWTGPRDMARGTVWTAGTVSHRVQCARFLPTFPAVAPRCYVDHDLLLHTRDGTCPIVNDLSVQCFRY